MDIWLTPIEEIQRRACVDGNNEWRSVKMGEKMDGFMDDVGCRNTNMDI